MTDQEELIRQLNKRLDREAEERQALLDELRSSRAKPEPEPFGPRRVARAYEEIERKVEESGAKSYEERQAALRRAQKGGE